MTRLALLSLAAALGAAAVPLFAQPPADANRDAFYCDERKLGSWFYCNSEEAKRKAREQARPASPAGSALAKTPIPLRPVRIYLPKSPLNWRAKPLPAFSSTKPNF